ncbi:DUF2971 domain-containing protein [Pedobacter sp. SL55]|uniref:DUF2971 domain-containing protein n=1 Tax=Pedobacter sp. SL55 TaxID=2995161 RepID=UPI002270F74C|nr:DUF2971 domain-containing protein [Pedobacter sp. SL55]WAC42242.1 DUF2971 domain-containing protein [Pedobacter sp. SL55]
MAEKIYKTIDETQLSKFYFLSKAYYNGFVNFYTDGQQKYYTDIIFEGDLYKEELGLLTNVKLDSEKLIHLKEDDVNLAVQNGYSPLLMGNKVRLPEYLYQYTSSQGLMGVLECKKLWATHANYLNDKSELYYAINLTKQCIKEEVQIFDEEAQRYLIDFLGYQIGDYPGLNDVFVTSFSENGDLLSQWRGYGANGCGFSIGFKSYLIDLTPTETERDYFICKVVYNPATQKELIKKNLHDFFLIVLRDGGKSLHEVKKYIDEIYDNSYMDFLNSIIIDLLTMKNPVFSEEAEWRLVALKPSAYFEKCYDNIKFRIDARKSIDNIIPYIEIDYLPKLEGLLTDSPIGEIIVGPQNDFQKSKYSVSILAKKYIRGGEMVYVKESRASSYRG